MKRNLADWLLALPTLLFTFWTFYGFLFRNTLFDGTVGVVANASVSAFLALVCLVLLRWKSPYRAKLTVSLISTLLALLAAEMALSWRRQSQLKALRSAQEAALEALGDGYDRRPAWEVIADLEKQGGRAVAPIRMAESPQVEHVVTINQRETVLLSGIANTQVVLCNECGQYLIYESDEYGFHNPKGMHQPDNVEIIALGDSFVQGSCVPSHENAIARIRQVHPRTLNLGTIGKGPLAMLGTLREYGEYLRPKIVLWIYYEGNDLLDLQRERKSPLLQYLQDDFSMSLRDHQPEIDRLLQNEFDARLQEVQAASSGPEALPRMESIGEVLFLKELRTRLMPSRLSGELESMQSILVRARERVSQAGGKLYFVYLPEYMRFKMLEAPDRYRDRARVRQMVENLQLPFVDVSEAFYAHGDPLTLFPFRLPGHYNPEGYRIAAETVLKAIEEGLQP